MELTRRLEIIEGEGLKTAVEVALNFASRSHLGQRALEGYATLGGERISGPELHTTVAGIEFDNPVLFGAGWDKKGRAVRGLYHLGFAGGDVGTVLPFKQTGNPKPRLWTIDTHHAIGMNCLGFNSPGKEKVKQYLTAQGSLPFPIGINVGKNKELPNEYAPWAHADVIEYLYPFASYFVLGLSSPNTPNLRALQDKGPLRENIQSSNEAMDRAGGRKPLLLKIDSERSEGEMDDMVEVALAERAAGFIACNTYMGRDIKSKYGIRWAEQMGGLSGADSEYQARTTRVVQFLYEAAGDQLAVMGVGGVNSAEQALSKIKKGASAVQVVTAIREHKGRTAAIINRGLQQYMSAEGVQNIQELIGVDTKRGVKKAA